MKVTLNLTPADRALMDYGLRRAAEIAEGCEIVGSAARDARRLRKIAAEIPVREEDRR